MALTGTYTRNLDEKQRLAVPPPLREGFGEADPTSLYVAPGTEQSLALYSSTAFQDLADRLTEQSRTRREVRNYLRLFYARAEKVNLDGQGRIRIPERLIEFAHLRHEVVLLGVHDHAEVWDRETWNQFLEQMGPSFDKIAARAFD